MKNPGISIVIPVYNEEDNIQKLHSELVGALKVIKFYEVVFVDDGSNDGSYQVLKKIAAKDKKIKVVKLMSNYGQSTAIAAGISSSLGKIIVTMDSDLQHDPKEAIALIKKINEGYHVACGWRKFRYSSDALIKKAIPSKISNFLIRRLTGVRLTDSTGGMRAFSRKVVETIPFYGEMHRYLPILAHWKGFKVTEVPITIRKRKFGKTKYNYKRIFRGFLDLMTIKFFIKYSTRPTHIFGAVGILSFSIGIGINSYFVYQKIANGLSLSRDVPSVILGLVLVLLGIMFLGFGFIADMISYDAITSQKRETYIVDTIIGGKNR